MIVPFPRDSALISTAFEVFKGTRESLLLVAPIVFTSRVLINMLTMQGHAHHLKVVTDTVLFFVGMYCLEGILMSVMEIPGQAQSLLANKNPVVLDNVPNTFYLMDMAIGISKLVDFITVIIFHILSIVYLCFMALAIILGGYVVFFATMFQVRKAFTVFVMIIFFLSMWPFIWYALDTAFEHILKVQNVNGSAAGTAVTMVVLAILKLLVPVGGFLAAAKAPVGALALGANAVKSGFAPIAGVKNAALGTAGAAGRATGFNKTADYLSTPVRKPISNSLNSLKKTTADSVPFAAYKTSQMLGRKSAAGGFENFKSEMKKVTSSGKSSRTPNSVKSSNSSSGSSSARMNAREFAKSHSKPTDHNTARVKTNDFRPLPSNSIETVNSNPPANKSVNSASNISQRHQFQTAQRTIRETE